MKNFSEWLIHEGHADAPALAGIDTELKAEMKKAVEFAIAAPYPNPNEVGEDVYA